MRCHFARHPRQQVAVACCATKIGCPRIGVCRPSFCGWASASHRRMAIVQTACVAIMFACRIGGSGFARAEPTSRPSAGPAWSAAFLPRARFPETPAKAAFECDCGFAAKRIGRRGSILDTLSCLRYLQSLIEVADDVPHVLDTYRQSYLLGRHAGLFLFLGSPLIACRRGRAQQ